MNAGVLYLVAKIGFMNKFIGPILILVALTACTKHQPNSSTQLYISMDPNIGTIYNGDSPDTFLVQLINPQQMQALPVVYHLPPGASVSTGKREGGVWKDTINILPNNAHVVTVTSEQGTTHPYVIVWQYVLEKMSFPNLPYTRAQDIFFDGNNIYAGTNNGLLLSDDGGQSFNFINTLDFHPSYAKYVNCVYAEGQTIYAGLITGLAVSHDGGKTFARHDYISPNGYAWGVSTIAVQGDTIYMGTGNGVMISRDRGATFDTTTVGIIRQNSTANIRGIYASGSTVYAGAETGLYISRDGGRTFAIDNNFPDREKELYARVNYLYVNNGVMYLANADGISVTADKGNTFAYYNRDYGLRGALRVVASGDMICVIDGGMVTISTDKGKSFVHYYNEDLWGTEPPTTVAMKGDVIYCGFLNGITVIKTRH